MNVAIIGTGIAGLAAAWLLDGRHRVTVYERNDWIGGHANTVDVPAAGAAVPVDTGFIVYNERNYPNLTALFAQIGAPTKPSDMSFAASLADGALEYAGTGVNGLLGQRTNIVRPRFWRMLRDLLRFYRDAPAAAGRLPREVTIGEFLRDERYCNALAADHLLPMGAAIWSTTAEDIKAYPAAAFIRFFDRHGLLTLTNRPQWRTVDGGSREYIDRLVAPFRHRIRMTAVRRIHRAPGRILVEDAQGALDPYDQVVLATHADEALGLLAEPDPCERRLLGAWRYTSNRAVLHRDPALMPKRRRVWSSWNFIGAGDHASAARVCVTYWMNRLQSLDRADPLFVTLNPVREPAPGTVIREVEYTHPFFDRAAMAAQAELPSLQGRRRTWYCGSYFGYGFHEDALASGLAVAERLGGVQRPWTVTAESGSIPPRPEARKAA